MSETAAKQLYENLSKDPSFKEIYPNEWEQDKERFLQEYVLNEHLEEFEDDEDEY